MILVISHEIQVFWSCKWKSYWENERWIRGKIISEFIGLKSKIYSLVDVDGKENKKAKALNKVFVRGIRYKESLMLSLIKLIRYQVRRIQSKLNKLGNLLCF